MSRFPANIFQRAMSASKSLGRILAAPDNGLQPLIDRARQLQSLTDALRQGIDQPFADHISLGNVRGDTAVVAADSPSWLSKIRYLGPALLHILQQQPGLASLQNIQFKVVPSAALPPLPPSRRAVLSPQGADILKNAATGMEDPKLAAALLRLARHAGRRKSL
jgi:hypothetical protein